MLTRGCAAVLAAARESPEWSSRQLATWVTDHLRSYRCGESNQCTGILREGNPLVKPPEIQLVAGKEYQQKTTGYRIRCGLPMLPGWLQSEGAPTGHYLAMVTVMDDCSRSILAWKLQLDMTADSLIQVLPARSA